MRELVDKGGSGSAVKHYYEMLESGELASAEQLSRILNLPDETRSAMESALRSKSLDAQAVTELLSNKPTRAMIESYGRVLTDARKAGIPLNELREAAFYVELAEACNDVKFDTATDPATRAELALVIKLEGLSAEKAQDIETAKQRLAETADLRARHNLSVRESLVATELAKDVPGFEINKKLMEGVREIERLAAERRIGPISTRDAMVTAAVLADRGQPVLPDVVKREHALADSILRVKAAHPQLSLSDAHTIASVYDGFTQMTSRKSDLPLDKVTLTHPHDAEMVRLQLDEYAGKRAREAGDWLKNGLPPDRSRELAYEESRRWHAVSETLLDPKLGPILSDLITSDPHLTWQTFKATDPAKLKELSTDRLADMMRSLTKERLAELDGPEKSKLTRALVAEAQERWKQGVSEERRAEFVRSWINTASLLPGDISEVRPAHFEILRSLTPADISGLSNEQLKRLTSSMSNARLENLPKSEQASLLIDLYREAGRQERELIRESIEKQIMTQLKPELLDHASKEELRWLSEETSRRLKQDSGLEGSVASTADLAREIARKIAGEELNKKGIDKMLESLSPQDRALALELLRERAPHLSEAGLEMQMKDLAVQLREKGFISTSSIRGRPSEAVSVVTFGDSTRAQALAYLLRKHTGLQVDVTVLKEGDPLPDKKVLLLDSPSRAPQGMRQMIESSPDVFKPGSLLAFHEGPNFMTLAAMESSPETAQRELTRMLDKAKRDGRTPQGEVERTGATTQAEFELLKNAVEAENGNYREKIEAKTLMYLLDKQVKSGGPVQVHAMVMNAALTKLTYGDMMGQAARLHQTLMNGGDGLARVQDASKVFYIVETKPDSNHLITDLYRTANGLTDTSYDRQFITMEQAMKMKGEGITFVNLNDGIYSSEESLKGMEKLAKLKDATGARVVTATLFGYEEGVRAARQASTTLGVDVVTADVFKGVHEFTADELRRKGISRLLGPDGQPGSEHQIIRDILKESELTSRGSRTVDGERTVAGVRVPKVTSGVFTPYMRSNSTAAGLGQLGDYLGVARAHNESRAEVLDERAAAESGGRTDLAGRLAEVRTLLSPMDSRTVESYLKTMNETHNTYLEAIDSPADMRFALEEGVSRFINSEPALAESMNLKGKQIEIHFGDAASAPQSDATKTVITLDPSLAEPANFNKARAEILRQLLEKKVSYLQEGLGEAEKAVVKQAVDMVVTDKMASVERPLVALEKITGIRNLTRVSDLFIVGGAPPRGKVAEPLGKLKEMGVHTIIDLRVTPSAEEKAWAEANGLRYEHMPLSTADMSNEQMDSVLKFIAEENAKGRKVFVHCQNCRDRAPSVVASWRMAQGMSHDTVWAEMRDRFHHTPTPQTRGVSALLPQREGRPVPEVKALLRQPAFLLAPPADGGQNGSGGQGENAGRGPAAETSGRPPGAPPGSPVFRKGGAPGLRPPAGGPQGGPIEVATGGADIRATEGGGFEVAGEGGRGRRPTETRTEGLTRQELARLKTEILSDRELPPERRAEALRTIELAESGNARAMEALKGSMARARNKGGGFDAATGKMVGLSMVVIALSGWYAMELERNSSSPHLAPASIN